MNQPVACSKYRSMRSRNLPGHEETGPESQVTRGRIVQRYVGWWLAGLLMFGSAGTSAATTAVGTAAGAAASTATGTTIGPAAGKTGEASLPREAVLPLALAQEAARAALEQCRAGGYRVSVAVVDRGGVLRVLLRDDGAGVHTVDSSRRKAYTATSLRAPTTRFAELIARKPELQGLRDMNASILMLGGGLPIRFGSEVVGGIGVGGAPGAHLDEDCARAGLLRIGAHPYAPGEATPGE